MPPNPTGRPNPTDKDAIDALRQAFPSIDALTRIRRTLEPSLKMAEQLHTIYQPILAHQAAIADHLSRIHFQALDSVATIAAQISSIQAQFVRSYQPFMERIGRMLEELPPRTRNGLLVLGRNGWFLDLEMPLPVFWEVVHAFERGETRQAHRRLVDHYEHRMSQIEQYLCTSHPHRSTILFSAFRAHNRGEYELAIPVFLAQADGICFESSGASLFRRRNGEVATAGLVSAATTQFQAALLAPLGETLPFRASESERDAGFAELNRHQVLHGESVDYGTELNGYKSISLVLYISQMVRKGHKPDDV